MTEYIPTKRNQIAKDFLMKSKFSKTNKIKSIKNLSREISEVSNSEYFILETNKKTPNIEIYE